MDEDKEFEFVRSCTKIVCYNCDGLCQHKTCSARYTEHFEIAVYGMRLHICLCDKHAEEMDEAHIKHMFGS